MCQVKRPSSSRSLRTNFNVGTLNVRGLNSDLKKQQLATDMSKYQLAILAMQETKFKKKVYQRYKHLIRRRAMMYTMQQIQKVNTMV